MSFCAICEFTVSNKFSNVCKYHASWFAFIRGSLISVNRSGPKSLPWGIPFNTLEIRCFINSGRIALHQLMYLGTPVYSQSLKLILFYFMLPFWGYGLEVEGKIENQSFKISLHCRGSKLRLLTWREGAVTSGLSAPRSPKPTPQFKVSIVLWSARIIYHWFWSKQLLGATRVQLLQLNVWIYGIILTKSELLLLWLIRSLYSIGDHVLSP